MRTHPLVLPLAALVVVACSEAIAPVTAPPDAPSFSHGPGHPRVVPELVSGNIPGSGNSVCNNPKVNRSGTVWRGYKVEGSGNSAPEGVVVTISGKKWLAWSSAGSGARVQAVVVKGGPNTHVYRYNPAFEGDGSDITSDEQLRAPLNPGKKIPDVSHYTVCVTDAPPVCLSAWAVSDTTLAQVLGQPAARGWQIFYNHPISPLRRSLWAAAQNDTTAVGATKVGTLEITIPQQHQMHFDFQIDAGWALTNSHLYFGSVQATSADPTSYPHQGTGAQYLLDDVHLEPTFHYIVGHVRVCAR